MADSSLARIADVGAEDGAFRNPTAGLFPASLALLPLLDALAPVRAQLPSLDALLRASAKKVRKLGERFPAMSADQRGALVLYTMEDTPRENSPYFRLNAALRVKDRAALRPWRDFCWLLLHALRCAPPLPAGTASSSLWRGAKVALASLGEEYEAGEEFQWSAFSSTASSVEVMNGFLGSEGPRTLFQLSMLRGGGGASHAGRDLREFSLFPEEHEVLLPPNVVFRVLSIFDAGGGLNIVQCEQVAAVDALLDVAAGSGAAAAAAGDTGAGGGAGRAGDAVEEENAALREQNELLREQLSRSSLSDASSPPAAPPAAVLPGLSKGAGNVATASLGGAAGAASSAQPAKVGAAAVEARKNAAATRRTPRVELLSAIRNAIGEGVPMWNDGDIAGCVRVYRALAARHAGDDARLAAALEEANNEGTSAAGWTLRRAMDDVLRKAGGGDAHAARADVCDALRKAIRVGVPLWNSGDRAACVSVYRTAARAHAPASARLSAAVADAQGQSTEAAGWTLREAFDSILEGEGD
jgi:hypothetical protein